MTPCKSLAVYWGEPAFSIAEAQYLRLDAAIGAKVRGDWAPFERRLAEGLACACRAQAEAAPADERAIDDAAVAFRYERDLIAVSDLNAWLEQSGLTTAEWWRFLTRQILRERWRSELDRIVDHWAPSAKQLQDSAVAEGICSGTFQDFERAYADRAAVALEADAELLGSPDDSDALKAESTRFARQHAHWLTAHAVEDIQARFLTALRFEQGFRHAADRLATTHALTSIMASRQVGWSILELDLITLPDLNAAREAMLCLRADGLSMHDVSLLARQPMRRSRVLVEDVPVEHQPLFLSAETGQVVGPLAEGDDAYAVARVISRTPATLDHEGVAERAKSAAIDAAVAAATRKWVRRG